LHQQYACISFRSSPSAATAFTHTVGKPQKSINTGSFSKAPGINNQAKLFAQSTKQQRNFSEEELYPVFVQTHLLPF